MRFLFCLWPHLHRKSSFRLPAQRVGLQHHLFLLLHQTLDWYLGFLRSVWDCRCCQKIQERDSESLLHQAALLHLHSLYKCLFHKWQVSICFLLLVVEIVLNGKSLLYKGLLFLYQYSIIWKRNYSFCEKIYIVWDCSCWEKVEEFELFLTIKKHLWKPICFSRVKCTRKR